MIRRRRNKVRAARVEVVSANPVLRRPNTTRDMPMGDALEESGVDTGIDLDALVDVARLACDLVGRPVESHVGKAGRRFGTSAKP